MRNRMIRPEFWSDEIVGLMSPLARLLFIGTWNLADDEGLLPWSAHHLKGAIFPFDRISITRVQTLMNELEQSGTLFKYCSSHFDQQFACIVNFKKHQTINRPTPSKLPQPTPEQRAEFNEKQFDRSLIHSVNDSRNDSRLREVKLREKKKDNVHSVSGSESFEQFWRSYPRKQAKGDARKAYEQALKRANPASIQAGVERYAAATRDTERKFIKLPAGWLRDERWLDEVAGNGSGNAADAKIAASAARCAELEEEEKRRRKELGIDGLH